jgi:hypothetical protein
MKETVYHRVVYCLLECGPKKKKIITLFPASKAKKSGLIR